MLVAEGSSVAATSSSGPRALPVLSDYDISSHTGFTPYPAPLARLTQGYYQPWEEIMDQLNDLVDSRQLRARMPLLGVGRLETPLEQKRAYSLLSIMAHSYVWGSGLDIAQSIPEQLAIPWQAVADIIDIPPVLTYASSNVWNWKLIDPNGPHSLENLTVLANMTGSLDEDWFVIISVIVEIEGGAAIQPLLEAMQAARADDLDKLILNLRVAQLQLEKVGKLLARMFEKCDPAVFYWKIRKFLAGSENAAELGLPNGLVYKGVNGDERKHLMGATAGQSSLFPALDIIFGVEHFNPPSPSSSSLASGSAKPIKKAPNALLLKMKQYMPKHHRDFLDHLKEVANLRAYILSKKQTAASLEELPEMVQEAISLFDNCVHQIKLFRDTHIQIVTRYILTQAKRGPPAGWEDYRVKVGSSPEPATNEKEEANQDDKVKGTGGSELMPFLKTNRDETNQTKLISLAK
ncbi:hypothetical protein BGW38_006628 [Lunasporangiospora selenospora]|uniref:Indoleamine 2,3-dioxygenase n=1 Tax=Lunasporangiospora selenospora TaxID=979761 RepID=A0A9P6KGT9_9FUNG|nr:hypothetical protein BGW38_006628 [Lunasporangiospora selenospora]